MSLARISVGMGLRMRKMVGAYGLRIENYIAVYCNHFVLGMEYVKLLFVL